MAKAEQDEKDAMNKISEKQAADNALRQKHIDDLKKLEAEEDVVENDDLAHLGDADKETQAGKDEFCKAQNDLSNEEQHEADVLRQEADQLHKRQAEVGEAEKQDLIREEEKARMWQHEAAREGEASRNHDQQLVAEENVAQGQAFRQEHESEHDAERDAYVDGQDPEDPEATPPPDPNDDDYDIKMFNREVAIAEYKERKALANAQSEDAKLVKKSFDQESEGEVLKLKGLEDKALAEEDRNSTALRKGENLQKQREEELALKKRNLETSQLSVRIRGWPLEEQRFDMETSLSNPVKPASKEKLLRSNLNLTLKTQGAAMFLPAPRRQQKTATSTCRKQNLKHFL